MKTKALILFLLMLGADIFLTSCCRCPKTSTYSYTLEDMSMFNTDIENLLEDGAVIDRSDFRVQMKIETDIKKIAESSHSGFLISNAVAIAIDCRCDHKTDRIIRKRSISKIEMLCDKAVWGIAAGDTIKDLEEFVLFYHPAVRQGVLQADSLNGRYNYSDFIYQMNSNYKYSLDPSPTSEAIWNMEFLKPTESDEFLNFTFIVTFSDRTQSEFTTKAVKILD